MKLIQYNEPVSFFRDWDSFFADPYRAFAPLFRSGLSSAHESSVPSAEWYEDDENYYAQVDLPGIRREDLKIDAEDGLLRLAHDHRETRGEDGETTERFEHVLRCPEGVQVSNARANLENGVLRLTLPKREESRPVSIEVK